ncbi:MAG: ATP-binding protein [Bacteroidota bacterium]|nr:ATP-binding protein [Bacteroidota bacterium]
MRRTEFLTKNPFPYNGDILSALGGIETNQNRLLETLDVSVYACDIEGFITSYNSAASFLWGRSPEIGIDQWSGSWKMYEVDGITQIPHHKCPMAVAIKGGIYKSGGEMIIEQPNGNRRFVLTYPKPIFDEPGKIVEVINTLLDITDFKQKEIALKESEEKYKKLATELEIVLRTQDEFISIASHELKTPITSLSMFLEMLIDLHPEIKDNQSNYMLKRSKAQVNRIINLVDEMLDISKIKAGKLDLNFEEVSLNEIVGELIHDYSTTIFTHKIIKIGTAKSKVVCDKSRIENVINNLVKNAIKYSSDADQIILTIGEDKDNINLSVQDFGIGLQKESLPKVFDRFFRAHGDKQGMLSGLGLGLFISADIIKRHNGKIWVESELGKGATFYFSLPKNAALEM